MLNFLLDIVPYPRHYDRHPRVIDIVEDTIDTVVGVGQQMGDGAGSGSSNLPFILGGLLAALIAMGFLIFMVKSYRKRGEQQVAFS